MFPKKNYNFDYKLPAILDGLTTIQDIERISPFFTDTNPVTYAIYLEANKNKLSQAEIEKTQNLIQFLTNKEAEVMKAMSEHLKTREEYENIMMKVEDGLDKHIQQLSASLDSSSES